MRYIGCFQIMEPKNLLKPYFETSVIFELFGFFYAVFTVVLRRMSSIIFYMCLYLRWGLFKNIFNPRRNAKYIGKFTIAFQFLLENGLLESTALSREVKVSIISVMYTEPIQL